MKIGIVVPTYNECENIISILDAIHQYLPEAHVLVVDDSSPDGTAVLVRDYAIHQDFVKLVVREEKEGLAAAYKTGFERLLSEGYNTIYQMDADFSHQPKFLPSFLEQIEQGNDLVVGSRYVSGGAVEHWSKLRKCISRLGSAYAATILNLPVKDATAGFKCWRAELLSQVLQNPLLLQGFGFQIEMTYRAHLLRASISEIPITFPDRAKGESKMSTAIFREALIGVLKLRRAGTTLVGMLKNKDDQSDS